MTRIITNIGASIQDKLKNKAKECGVPNNKMITKYLLERFIYRLSVSQYADNFVLKGSVLSTLFITDSKFIRPTKDVDFLAKNISNSLENISRVISDVAKIEYHTDGVVFLPVDDICNKVFVQYLYKASGFQHSQIILVRSDHSHDCKCFDNTIVIGLHAQIVVQQPGLGTHPQKPPAACHRPGKHSPIRHEIPPLFF